MHELVNTLFQSSDMIYQHAKEASSEILRLAIPAMAQHNAGFHPVSYTVWYEYLAGLNPKLQNEIQTLLGQGTKLTDEQIQTLYDRHIRKRDEQLEQETETELRRVVSDVCRLTHEARDNAGQFQDVLMTQSNQLHEPMDQTTLSAVVTTLVNETVALRESMTKLEAELQERDRQVQSLRESVHAAQDQAMTDPLTGLNNRRGYALALQELKLGQPAQSSEQIMLLMFDIDHFKQINDTHGHLMGDKVIRNIGKILRSNVKGRDIVARLGGEEFAVILENTPIAGAVNVAEQIRQIIAGTRFRRTDTQADIGKVTISVGIASYTAPETGDAFTHRADMALYESKKSGRNRVSVAK